MKTKFVFTVELFNEAHISATDNNISKQQFYLWRLFWEKFQKKINFVELKNKKICEGHSQNF